MLAARENGIKPVWSSEIDEFPMAVSRFHFPDVLQLGDINNLDGATLPPVDIICAGSPCQDLSLAGKRRGLDGERSGLFKKATEIVYAMRHATNGQYPKWFVWENVPGAFTSNRGNDFRVVLEEITKESIPMPGSGKWTKAGMVRGTRCSVSWRVLNAQYWGVPQRRKRIFLIADFRAERRPEILFEPESVHRNTKESEGARKRAAADAKAGVRTANRAVAYGIGAYASNAMKSSNPHSGIYAADTAKTLDSSGGNPACNQGGIAVVALEGNGMAHPCASYVLGRIKKAMEA